MKTLKSKSLPQMEAAGDFSHFRKTHDLPYLENK